MATGVASGTRITIAMLIAGILGLFILAWDGGLIPIYNMPYWLGFNVFLPLIAVVVVFGADCIIQQLSCGKVDWLTQLQRAAVAPIPFWVLSFVLYMLPGLRWPIEGLAQSSTPFMRHGYSSAFYVFWCGLYIQSILISLAQLC